MNRIRTTLTIAAAVTGCIADRDVELAGHQAAALTDGRTFELMLAAATEPIVVEVGGTRTEDAHLDTLLALLVDDCEDAATARLSTVTQPGAATCSVRGDTLAMQTSICEGHRWLQLAEAVAPTDVYLDGRVLPRRPLEPHEQPSELLAELRADGLQYTVPVPNNNSAASFALLATEAFQHAALSGAKLVDPQLCPDGFLNQNVPADPTGTATVKLALVVSMAVGEALVSLHEAAETAQSRIQAAALATESLELDEVTANYDAWAGEHNSRAEALSIWSSLPVAAPLPGAGPTPPVPCSDVYPNAAGLPPCLPPTYDPVFPVDVCSPAPGTATADDDAIDLLRAVGVDPRTAITDWVTGTARTPDNILRDVRDAMIEDFPGTFTGTGTMPARDWIAEHTNTTPEAILRAAWRISEDQRVRGRVITRATTGSRGSATVRRVIGTSEGPFQVDRAFLFARTAGAARFDDSVSLTTGRTQRGLTGNMENQTFAPDSYASRGVLATIDAVRGALGASMRRVDMGATTTPTEPAPGTARWNAWSAIEFARTIVPHRVQVAVGRRVTGGVDRVRVRLFGVVPPVDANANNLPDNIEYDLWLGEAGLQCATTGTVEGESCNRADYLVNVTGRIVTDTANSGGLGAKLLEWTVLPTSLPGRPTAIPDSSRFYVTRRGESMPRSVVGFTATSGSLTGTYSRVNLLPAGLTATTAATDPIEPSDNSCDQPERCCNDLPCGLRLTLENEITEAREGRDDIESSFDHYLRIAREAADEADSLGQELIQAGLEMDLRAEAARERLEDRCGGVVNVGSLSPRPCTVVNDCCNAPPCDDGHTFCDIPGVATNGLCRYEEALTDFQVDNPDAASVMRCLGDDHLVSISLGDRELCYYQRNDGSAPPCDCGDTECPECPVFKPASGDCSDAFPAEIAAAQFDFVETRPMFKSVSDEDGFGTPDCTRFAQLRSGDEAAVDALLEQTWLSQTHAWAMGETIGYTPSLFMMGAVTRAGSQWLVTGSETDGPEQDEIFPCGEHSSLTEDQSLEFCGDGSYDYSAGRPLICGIGHELSEDGDGCVDRDARTRLNHRLFNAAAVLAALGGASGRYLERAGYRGRYNNDQYEAFPWDWPEVDSFGRNDMFLDSGCTNDEVDGFTNESGMCWIRRHAITREGDDFPSLWFPRFCDEDDPALNGCTHEFTGIPDGSSELATLPLPGWFEAAHGPGDIRRFFDGGSDGDENGPHAVGLDDPEARCVMVFDGIQSDDLFLDTGGAMCPTYFTRVPASFEELEPNGAQRTDPLRLAAFWSRLSGPLNEDEGLSGYDEDNDITVPTLREFFEDVAAGSRTENGLGTLRLDEFPDGAVSNGQILDALELACLSAYENGGGCPAQLEELPEVNDISDFRALQRMLECAASRIEFSLEKMIVMGIPEMVADDLESGQNTGTFPAYRGEYGARIAELRGALEAINVVTSMVARALRNFGHAMDVAASELELADLESELALNQIGATMAAQAFRCAQAQVAEDVEDYFSPLKRAKATLECADAGVQIGFALTAQAIQQEIGDAQQRQVFLQLAQTFGEQMDSLDDATTTLAQAYADLNRLMSELDAIRNGATRDMAQVLFLDTDSLGREYNVNRVMRARMSTLRERYDRARDRAIEYSWVAKLALEQKLGIRLEDLENDLTFVDAPSKWVGTVCSMPGIDYDAIRDVSDPGAQDVSYADEYIGDYVDMLESVKESYPFDFPFTDGDDTTIVSLRDGIAGSRILCDAVGPNLLHQSSDVGTIALGGEGAWFPECDEDGYCLGVTAMTGSPFTTEATENAEGELEDSLARALGGATVVHMQVVDPVEPPADPIALPPRWMQARVLAQGTYLFSWYERLANPPMGMDECGPFVPPASTRLLASASGEMGELDVSIPASGPYLNAAAEPWLHSCWRRTFVIVDNPTEQLVRVGLSVRQAPAMPPYPSVDWSAPQLERVSPDADLMSVQPQAFFPTDDDLAWPVALCEDTYGDVFRAESWSSGCVDLCPSGFAESCDTVATTHCYHQMQFAIDLSQIESGNVLSPGTFALGNYNYRTLDLAVNLVGVGVRDCTLTDRVSECNASGYIPFSLRHDGPYTVRNHMGEEYDAPLFIGNIEHGRALTSERYLSNPISSADESLLGRYWRNEFAGRPMSGLYTIRIWDTPGLVWDRVRDVQLAIKYRYWTRFE